MTALVWDQTGARKYETGVDHGILFLPDESGDYVNGYAWNGLTTVTESPSGADASPQYADNIKYLNLIAAEEFGGTIEAFTSPPEFDVCDGTASPAPGVTIGQQRRQQFGLAYRTKIGNDLDGDDHGFKIHLVYNALAAPSEKAYATVNDSPEATAFSWEFTTTPVNVPGYKPSATIVIDSTIVDADALADFLAILNGSEGTDPRLPSPADVFAAFSDDGLTLATPTAPTFDSETDTITIPTVTGVVYKINGVTKSGAVVITEDTIVNAYPGTGYKFPEVIDTDWFFEFT